MKNIIKKSYHGNRYSIPENYSRLFVRMDEDIQNAEYNSKEQQVAIDLFDDEFAGFEKA